MTSRHRARQSWFDFLDNDRFKALCLFSVALLGTIVFSFAAWSLLSVTLNIPTSAEVVASLGVIGTMSGIVKPEPVENYTFLLSTGLGVFLFGSVGYLSAVDPSKFSRLAKSSLVLVTLWILMWLTAMQWDSIVPPNPSVLITSPIAQPWMFFGLLVFMVACVWISAKLELTEKWRYVPLVLACVPLLVLSRMVLTSNDDDYIVGHAK
jgi:hypothetical protein